MASLQGFLHCFAWLMLSSSCRREEIVVPQEGLGGWVPTSEILHVTCRGSHHLEC